MIHGHGGNIFDNARQLGCNPADILDMSSNVNPLGLMPGLIHHLALQLEQITALPEADAGSITRLFSDLHGMATEKVLAGNGTTQLIYILPGALKLRQILILGPTYADYEDACRMNGVSYRCEYTDAPHGFRHDFSQLEAELEHCNAVVICNPNNPTGVLIPRETIMTLCQKHPEILFILDESYMPFVPDPMTQSLITCNLPNVIVLNSMSKIFRIPGLRIGFVIAPPAIITSIARYMLPWSVNALAQAAVAYLMTHDPEVTAFIQETQNVLSAERQFIIDSLQSAFGLTLFPSVTSFILGELKRHTAAELAGYLLKDRILIRNCANFGGLSERYFRISLKTHAVNAMLADRLRQFCAETTVP